MSTSFRTLGANSAIYVATNLLQKCATFLLMPLYTRYLDPTAYGTFAIVTAVNGFLSIAFTLGLTAAVTRFYFEYQEDPATLAQFWGSILTFIMLLSVGLGAVLLLVGEQLLRPFIGNVAFWPYVALGVITTFFQPFFSAFLMLLQTRNQATRYAVISLANFLVTTGLTVTFVVVLRWGATGALLATMITAVTFFGLSLYLLRSQLTFGLKWQLLREAFAYSLPQVPHSLASQTTAMADRLILNSKLGSAAAGLYSVGGMISMAVEVAAFGVNRAYVPLSMSALKSGDLLQLARLRVIGSLVVGGFCLVGAGISVFGPEIVRLLAAPAFAGAAAVIPLLIFVGVGSAIYYVLVSVLFFDRKAVKLLPLCTLSAALLNVGLAMLLIPAFGLMGAAVASLLAQVLATILVAVIGRRFDPVRWDYGRYVVAFISSLAAGFWLSRLTAGGTILLIAIKLGCLLVLAALLGAILWGRPFILADAAIQLLRCRPSQAAALFTGMTA
jgi:O-antigen/teichoic acid export membrane protein